MQCLNNEEIQVIEIETLSVSLSHKFVRAIVFYDSMLTYITVKIPIEVKENLNEYIIAKCKENKQVLYINYREFMLTCSTIEGFIKPGWVYTYQLSQLLKNIPDQILHR